LVRAKKK
jgi:hypothetical protein